MPTISTDEDQFNVEASCLQHELAAHVTTSSYYATTIAAAIIAASAMRMVRITSDIYGRAPLKAGQLLNCATLLGLLKYGTRPAWSSVREMV